MDADGVVPPECRVQPVCIFFLCLPFLPWLGLPSISATTISEAALHFSVHPHRCAGGSGASPLPFCWETKPEWGLFERKKKQKKERKQPTKKPQTVACLWKRKKKKQPQTSKHFISSAFVLAWIICETNRIHWWLLAMTLPAWNTLVRRSTATEPNNLSQNICNHLTLALTFKSIFSYSSQKTLSMAKETQEKDSSTNKKRYRGNSTQIRWQKIIQFAHFYSAAQTGVEFIFTLSLFMLFKHNIH